MRNDQRVALVACVCIPVGIYLIRDTIEDSFLEINDTWEIEQDIINTLSQTQEYTLEDYLHRYSEQIERDIQRMIAQSEDRRQIGSEEHPQKFSPDPIVFRQLLIRSYTVEYHTKMQEWCRKKAKELLIQRVAETYIHHFGLQLAAQQGQAPQSAIACARMFYSLYAERLNGYTKGYTVCTPEHELYGSVNFLGSSKSLANAYHNQGEFSLEDLCKVLLKNVTSQQKLLCPILRNPRLQSKITLDSFNQLTLSGECSQRRNLFDDIIIDNCSMFFNIIRSDSDILLNAYNACRMQTETMTYFITELPQIVKVFHSAVFCQNRTTVQDLLQQQFVKFIERSPCMYRTLFNNKEFKQLISMYKSVRHRFCRKYDKVIPIEHDLISLVFGYL